MRKLIYDQSERVVAFMREQLQFDPAWNTDVQAIGIEDETGRLLAGICYEGFTLCDVNMHVASLPGVKNWTSREAFVRVFHYPFVDMGLRRVTGLVPSKNKRAMRLDLHMGFQVEGVMRNALPDDDMIVLGLLRENCRFLEGLKK